MNQHKHILLLTRALRSAVLVLGVAAAQFTHAATLWTGPNFTYTEASIGAQDVLISNAVTKVSFARGGNGPLYNPAAGETGSDFISSPADTTWAFGMLTNYTNLNFVTFPSFRNGNLSAVLTPNKPMVVHILSADIYLALTFTTWTFRLPLHPGSPGFAYVRSTPAVAVAPTVSISSPPPGATFAAPASMKLTATAAVSGGSVTNVEYFAGTTSLGHATSSPFSVIGKTITVAGPYALTAVATAAGLSATSAVVNITVVTPVATSNSPPTIANGQFSFHYTANPGLTYVVQSTSDFLSWSSVVTNVPVSSPVPFSETVNSNSWRFYRVVRQPNP